MDTNQRTARVLENPPRRSALSTGGGRTIGLLAALGTGAYENGLLQGVRASAAARGVHVINLMCGSLDITISDDFEAQNNLLWNMATRDVFDGLIVIPSFLYNFAAPERVREVLDGFGGIPRVGISEPVPGGPALFVDNMTGIRDLVRHIHDRHGRRRFAFISGPATNNDAAERMRGFIEGVQECGLPLEPGMAYEGDYWWAGGREGARFLFGGDVKPDALICANDYMAYGAYQVLETLGLRVPEDVVLTGVDNDPGAIYANPPLTTIEQPLDVMADRAVELLCQMMDGIDVPNRIELPTRTIFRRSCGCNSGFDPVSIDGWEAKLDDDGLRDRIKAWVAVAGEGRLDADKRSVVLDSLYHILSVSGERGKISLVRSVLPVLLDSSLDSRAREQKAFFEAVQAISFESREVELGLEASTNVTSKVRETRAIQNIISVYTLEEMLDRLAEELPALGVTCMFLNLFSKPFNHDPRQPWPIPSKARCVFAYVDGEVVALPHSASLFKTDRLIPENVPLGDKHRNLISISCFFRQVVYGFVVFESKSDDVTIVRNLATHVSSAYRSILEHEQLQESAKHLERAMRQLRVSNKKLNDLSTRDTLTGLYNRRGFILIGDKVHNLSERSKSDYALFFADIDGLKAINDRWGHEAGDEAIAACGDILRRTFRDSDVVARLGGDEFTILVSRSSPQDVRRILSRLDETRRQHNSASGKPWQIDLSIGHVFMSGCPGVSFTEVMAKADEELYRRKRELGIGRGGRGHHAADGSRIGSQL
jgi:diguanylate cyclase (GGDEF)-like protein